MRIFHVAETFLTRLLLVCGLIALPQGAALAQGAAAVVADGASSADAPAEATDSTLSGLLEVLKDDAARERLIAALEEAAAEGGSAADGAAAAEPDVPVDPVSIGRQLAETTQAIAQSAADSVSNIWSRLGRAGTMMGELDADTWATIGDAALDLLLVLLVTVATYIVLRRAMIPIYRRMGRYAKTCGPILGLGTGVLAVLIDALIVIVAWAVGYVVTTTVFGEFGQIGFRQTLYLNAFLAVELVKVAARAILSPSTADLRVLSVSDLAAKRCSRVTNIVVSLLGYGQLLVVPIVNGSAGYFAGRAVAAVVAFLAVLYLIAALIRYRESVGNWLVEQLLPWRKMNEEEREAAGYVEVEVPEGEEEPEVPRVPADGWLARLLKLWWLPGIAYLVFMLYVAVTQPISAVSDALVASLRVALAIVAGLLIGRVITGMAVRGVHLPDHINQKIPLLDARINRLVPNMLFGVRWIVVIAVVAFALETLGILSAWSWLRSPAGLSLSGTIIVVALILIIAYAIWVAFSSWVDYRLNPDYGEPPSSRETTLLTLLRNAVTVALIILTLMFALAELGLNIGPLIASAGVLGLAIGFGAQKLVQDIITGVFIQFENAINVGDVVTVGGITGGVERLTVRSVTLRDLQGIVHIVPFSSVDMVSNFTREFSYYVVDMGIAYREDVDEAKQAMFDAYELLREDPEQGMFLLGDLEYFGLDQFGDSAVVLKCRVKTWPGKQWGVGRAYNRYLKKVFDERGIEIPFPHQTLFFGEAKDGSVQTLPIRQITDARGSGGDDGGGGGAIGPDDGRGKPTDDAPLGDDD